MPSKQNRREARARPQLDWRGRVERLGWNGVGLGRLQDGRVVLLNSDLALFPGEVVRARLELHSGHAEGRVVEWLERDPRRAPAQCAFAAECGGCRLWEGGAATAELKWQMVQDLLARQMGGAPECSWLPALPGTLRNRIQLHWDGASLGFHQAGSNTVVPVPCCPMAQTAVSATISALRRALETKALPDAPDRWELATGSPAEVVVATAVLQPGVAWTYDKEQWRPSSDILVHHLGRHRIQQHPGTFFQSCPEWAWGAFAEVLGSWNVSGDTLFDLYGGCGFFSVLLAEQFSKSVLVESSEASCASAEANLAGLGQGRSGLKSRVICGDVGGWLQPELGEPGDVVLLDPPRAGLTSALCTALLSARAETLLLIGCDGMAFCRDVKRLAPTWSLKHLAAIDLFPNTPQVELVGLLGRADNRV